MHHLPQFLLIHGGSRKKNKNKKNNKTTPSPLPKPKLERMNARKNINYEPPDASSSCSLDESSYSLSVWSSASEGNRLFNIPTSFRIDGSDVGQVDLVCRSLGFDSADELGIPIDSWNASKIRSSSDLVVPVGASRLSLLADCDIIDVETVKNVENFENVENVENRCDEMVRVCYADVEDKCDVVRVRDSDDTGVRIGNGIKGVRPPVLSAPVVMRQVLQNEDENGCDEIIRGCSADVEDKCDVVRASGGMGARVGNGIKGVRPPVLSAPVVPRHVLQHEVGCEWDDVRSFASREGFGGSVNERFGLLDEEEEGDVEDVSARIERVRLSASCSFSTSNDDDSSSSTTEPLSSGSPSGVGCRVSAHGRFRHITITHWQRGDLLGRGSFGSVYEGICDGGYFIAIKEVSLLDQGEQGRQSVIQLEQEIALLSQFEHDNIVRYYGTDKDDSKLYIFLELVTKGSLLSLYQRYRLQDCQVSSYTRQILHGLKYLHDRHVVHRDVKCANILVDANGSVKLADFGLAKATTFNDVKSCKGTAFWMAPEVVNQKGQGYGLAADIWSLGCTVLEMLTHRIPYSPMECMAALFKIGNGIPPPVPDNLSREARDFISQCFRINPADRPTASQLLDHPFVRRPLPLSTAGIIS